MSELIDAILTGERLTILKLVNSGTDIDIQDEDGRTPLMHAVIENDYEVAKLLMDNGANIDIQDNISQAAALHFAAQQYALEIAKLMLSKNAIVDTKDKNGNTPLSDAVFYSEGKGEFIKLLLGYGADPHNKNNFAVSPYELAMSIDNYDLINFFIKD
ncbi:ankyrin repeat domain-containing protein [Bacillus alkalisoli]|uniref:ankyrin repeat domain-containing protein n=1 Tax=Bacillus alkalisoli TaxID=2011008 RepID=UPI000C246464|nr:ankyrin repeat domain-containing protein [Bacillus alkalisoli]